MRIRWTSSADLADICANLRPADLAEVQATRFDPDPAVLALDLASGLPRAQMALTFCDEADKPVAFLACWLIAPGTGTVALLATAAWPSIARAAHRFTRRVFIGRIAPAAYRRLECRTMASHAVSRAWLKALGFREEGVAVGLGRDGEDFIHCAWTRPVNVSEGHLS